MTYWWAMTALRFALCLSTFQGGWSWAVAVHIPLSPNRVDIFGAHGCWPSYRYRRAEPIALVPAQAGMTATWTAVTCEREW